MYEKAFRFWRIGAAMVLTMILVPTFTAFKQTNQVVLNYSTTDCIPERDYAAQGDERCLRNFMDSTNKMKWPVEKWPSAGVTYCASGKVSASMTLTHRCIKLVYDHAMAIVPHPDEACREIHLPTPLVRRFSSIVSDLGFKTHVGLGEDHRIRKWLGTWSPASRILRGRFLFAGIVRLLMLL